jgi:predicted anti-sigma-YlaC factor YlaD
MSECEHLTEMELSCLADWQGGAKRGEHLRRCSDCRNRAAEYRWLHRQTGSALKAAAETVVVPRPRWRAVRRGLRAKRQRCVAGWRASAVGSAVLAVCAMLYLSPVFGEAVAQTVFPARATLPEPPSPSAIESVVPSLATPTPAASVDGGVELEPSTPGLIPLPTPAVEPET